MREPLPTVLVPGLRCSARLFAPQIPQLWRSGAVMIADHTRGDSIAAIAGRILEAAPSRFGLVGLSMGGFIAFEVLRRAPERIARLALLDTSARPEAPAQTERRLQQIGLTQAGRYDETIALQFPQLVHPDRRSDAGLLEIYRLMCEETGPEVFIRHQHAIMARPDSRPGLGAIRCPTLVLVGDVDELTPPAHAEEMAAAIPGARLVVVPDCGHLATLERPAAVNAALAELTER